MLTKVNCDGDGFEEKAGSWQRAVFMGHRFTQIFERGITNWGSANSPKGPNRLNWQNRLK